MNRRTPSSEPWASKAADTVALMTEQRPRMQTRASVVPLGKDDAVLFAVNSRPVRGGRGDYRVKLRLASANCARVAAIPSAS